MATLVPSRIHDDDYTYDQKESQRLFGNSTWHGQKLFHHVCSVLY